MSLKIKSAGGFYENPHSEESSGHFRSGGKDSDREMSTFHPVVEQVQAIYSQKISHADFREPCVSHAELFEFGHRYLLQGEYQGLGLNQKQVFPHPTTHEPHLCDSLYLVKERYQVICEEKGGRFIPLLEKFWWKGWMVNRRILQEKLAELVCDQLKGRISLWGYDAFVLCNHQRLAEYGFLPEDAQAMHAILLFYKKKENVCP